MHRDGIDSCCICGNTPCKCPQIDPKLINIRWRSEPVFPKGMNRAIAAEILRTWEEDVELHKKEKQGLIDPNKWIKDRFSDIEKRLEQLEYLLRPRE